MLRVDLTGKTFAEEPLSEDVARDFIGGAGLAMSGDYLAAAFECTRSALGPDKIVLGTDHPYETMEECMAFLDGLPLSDSEREQLYRTNAAGLGFTI